MIENDDNWVIDHINNVINEIVKGEFQ